MNSPNAFDELLRSRLSELHDPMQEAHWQDMRSLLSRQRRRRRGLVLLLFGLFAGAGAAYLMLRPSGETAVVATVQEVAPRNASPSAGSTPTSTERRVDVATDHPQERATGNTERIDVPVGSAKAELSPSPSFSPSGEAERSAAQADKKETPEPKASAGAATRPGIAAIVGAPDDEVRQGVEPVALIGPATEPFPAAVVERTPAPDRIVTLEVPADPYGPGPGTPVPPDPLPAVPNTSWAWEIGLHAGLGRTRLYPKDHVGTLTHGSGTDGMAGVEVMRMGRHVGFGTGLHKACFGDEAVAQDRTVYGSELKTVFFLSPVDTIVTTVVDTIVQGGITYYVTGQMDTTLLVLDSMVDTLTTSETIAGFQRTERLCVVEVPLLVDLHTRVGRWSLGVRGGPTVGMITGANLVRTDGEGSWEREAFSSPTFGYTARGYVRYAITPQLALGVEPALRGLLNDPSPGLGLRPMSYGVVGSLSLRLPAGR